MCILKEVAVTHIHTDKDVVDLDAFHGVLESENKIREHDSRVLYVSHINYDV